MFIVFLAGLIICGTAFAQSVPKNIRSLALGGNTLAALNDAHLTTVWDNPALAIQTETIDIGFRTGYSLLLDGDGDSTYYNDTSDIRSSSSGKYQFQRTTGRESFSVKADAFGVGVGFGLPFAKNNEEASYKGRVKMVVDIDYSAQEVKTRGSMRLKDGEDDYDTWYSWEKVDQLEGMEYKISVAVGVTDRFGFAGGVIISDPMNAIVEYSEEDNEDNIDADEYTLDNRMSNHPQTLTTFQAGLIFRAADPVILGATYVHGTDVAVAEKDNLSSKYNPDPGDRVKTTLAWTQTRVSSLPRQYGLGVNWMAWDGGSLLFNVNRTEISDPESNSNVLSTSTTNFGFAIEGMVGGRAALRGAINYKDRNGFDSMGEINLAGGVGFSFAKIHSIDLGLAYARQTINEHVGHDDGSTASSTETKLIGISLGAQYYIQF
jgi:hypothetical protein